VTEISKDIQLFGLLRETDFFPSNIHIPVQAENVGNRATVSILYIFMKLYGRLAGV
jgi:hypothetical protein